MPSESWVPFTSHNYQRGTSSTCTIYHWRSSGFTAAFSLHTPLFCQNLLQTPDRREDDSPPKRTSNESGSRRQSSSPANANIACRAPTASHTITVFASRAISKVSAPAAAEFPLNIQAPLSQVPLPLSLQFSLLLTAAIFPPMRPVSVLVTRVPPPTRSSTQAAAPIPAALMEFSLPLIPATFEPRTTDEVPSRTAPPIAAHRDAPLRMLSDASAIRQTQLQTPSGAIAQSPRLLPIRPPATETLYSTYAGRVVHRETSTQIERQTANAPSACQSLADALVATWSATKAAASETCGRMYICETTGRQTNTETETLHRISSGMQLLPSRDRELFERQLQASDSHVASEQVAGLQP